LKVLVTGGAGFIGSNLISELVKDESLSVFSLDNYFTGKKSNHIQGATYIEGEAQRISESIDFKPDVVFHFGEYSRVSTSFEDFDKVWDYNIKGTYRVLEFCRKNGCKLIYSASSTKFADSGSNKDASPYAFFKSQNTDLIKNYHDWFGLEYAICYFYNVYGTSQITTGKYATVIGIFEKQYSEDLPLTVVKPGYQTRDFTHISDIVSGLTLVMKSGAGDKYCFGTGKTYKITDVAKLFKDDILFIEERLGERFESFIDLRKSYELGWRSRVDLEEYIKKIKEKKL
jgi:UDP-glucose 4-epimerase